jgi:uncharacterized protein YbbC (DUF1343 family)
MLRVATGLERIASGDDGVLRALRGRRLGLCAHPASVDSRLLHARQVFDARQLTLSALFGPEHGYGGEAQDMISIRDGDANEPLPVYSLYGPTEADLSPRPSQLDGLDAIVIDLQDVGARYYTFVWTAVLIMRAAAQRGIETVVLDRPNPLGGEILEGAPQRPGYQSFVGLCDVPVRHGLTIGELCRMAQEREGLDREALRVIPMLGYDRSMSFEDTGLPWVFPSPNMPTADTARVYPGGCLLEATNLSEGRGTTRPFELVGAPWIDAERFASAMNGLRLPGVHFRPAGFEPTFQKHAKQPCGGCQIHVTDRTAFRPVTTGVALIDMFRRFDPARFAWRQPPYEYERDKMPIDILAGSDALRKQIEAGVPVDEIAASWLDDEAAFGRLRQPFLLY